MTLGDHFTHHFLIATPSMRDAQFSDTVVYLCEHGPGGAMGMILNRPSPLNYARLLDRMDIDISATAYARKTVLKGGPMHHNRGFVLHRNHAKAQFSSTMEINADVALTTSRDILEAMRAGDPLDEPLITLGYASWGPGQLEFELAQTTDWLIVPATTKILFDTPMEERYHAAVGLLGIDIKQLLPTHSDPRFGPS